jgi:endonuclease/exonuclease/phosphatase family metal-dependent hydrolase
VHVSQIAAEIEAVQPDLVSLNEVDSHTLRTRVDEPAHLAEATGLHVVYGPNLIYDGGPFGNAILTRYPVVESHNLRLPGTFGLEPRGLLTAIVIVDRRRVAFSSTHLTEGSGGRQSRLLQALAVARTLHSMAAPTILAGDLNSDSTDVPGRILRGHLLDAQEEGGTGLGDTFPEAKSQQQVRLHLLRRPLRRGAWEHTGADLGLQRPSVGVHEADLAPKAPVLTNAHRTQRRLKSWPSYCGRTPRRAPTYPGRGGLITKTTKGRRHQTVPIIEPLRLTLDRVTGGRDQDERLIADPLGWRHDCDPGCSRGSWIDSPKRMINISRRQAGRSAASLVLRS